MNKNLFEAKKCFPGGVNSPVRAFKSVGMDPLFIQKAYKSKIVDSDGREYIDYVGSWGPAILGHADETVIEAVQKKLSNGLSFGAPTTQETELANLIKEAFPHMERMRFVSSGTEATMSAVRLMRGYTGKPLIIKIDGAYHGHSDSLLASAGSGVATFGTPDSAGIPAGIVNNTLVVPFNDIEAVKKCFAEHTDQIAGIIIEPVCGNMGVVLPEDGYLEALRKITKENKALLIFDEVMTGFRACYGGVSTLKAITPDITCLGKIVGGGMPLAVYGGKKEILAMIAPDGPVYQAGTLSGNPIAVAAGIATLSKIKSDKAFYVKLIKNAEILKNGIEAIGKHRNLPLKINSFGSMLTIFFSKEKEIKNYADAKKSDTKLFAAWFKKMLENGVYLAPSQFEAMFISAAHTKNDIDLTLEAADSALAVCCS